MGFLKFSADYIFTGHEIVDGSKALIVDSDGKIIDFCDKNEAGDDIRELKGLLTPGFVNAHCHLELSHMKGAIAQHSGMTDFLIGVILKRAEQIELQQEAIVKAEIEMLINGIVAVGDICNTTATLKKKLEGKLYYHSFVEVTGFATAQASDRINQAKETNEIFKKNNLSSSIVPHAPYSVSSTLLKRISELSGNNIVSIHNQESEDESIFFEQGTGPLLKLFRSLNIDYSDFTPPGSSLLHVLAFLKNVQSLILVHNVHSNEDEIRAVEQQAQQAWWCLCPNANLYINQRLPDVKMFQKQNCKMVVGTDSLASNNQLNILEELKALQSNDSTLATSDLLKWATINGARALQIDNRFGSFEKGKRPGLVLIDELEGSAFTSKSSAKRVL